MSGARRAGPRWRQLRSDLALLHEAALAAAEPAGAVRRSLAFSSGRLRVGEDTVPLAPRGRLLAVAVGKAAEGMLRGAREACGGRLGACLVISRRSAGTPLDELPPGSRRLSGSHPLPDRSSVAAGGAVREFLAATRRGDVVLLLLSGGASALLESPRPPSTLRQIRGVTAALSRAGADVNELNTVRRALSSLKGGGLALLASPARVVTLALSDVVGDAPETIGSGPGVPSPTGPREALRVLRETGAIASAPELARILGRRSSSRTSEASAPRELFRIVASNLDAALAVCAAARRLGFRSQVATTFLSGEAREAGRLIGGCAVSMRRRSLPFAPPGCLVFGGETTVSRTGRGRGGRNLELALGASVALAGVTRAAVFSFATDGVDGSSDAAGALATGDTIARAAALGLTPRETWAKSATHDFFASLGDLWKSGPTGTNVNDLAIALAYPGGESREGAAR